MRLAFWIIGVAVLLAVAAVFYFMPERQDAAVRHEREFLQSVLSDAESGFPGAVGYDALVAARVQGRNGWPSLRRAIREAERLRDHNARTYWITAHGEVWLDFSASPEVAEDFIALTQPVSDHVADALAADCLVRHPIAGATAILQVATLQVIMSSRVNALHASGRLDEARSELRLLLQFENRLDPNDGFMGYSLSVGMRAAHFHWMSGHLPPELLDEETLSLVLQPAQASLQQALQAELALAMDDAAQLAGTEGVDLLEGMPPSEAVEYLRQARMQLSRTVAALGALGGRGNLADVEVARALVGALQPLHDDTVFPVLTPRMILRTARAVLEGRAAELALRLRHATSEGLPPREAAESMAAQYPGLMLMWHEDRLEFWPDPEAPLTALLPKPESPLATLAGTRAPAEVYDVTKESVRRFR